jgi:hypothetical protein
MKRNQHKRALREGRAREATDRLVCVTSIHLCGGPPSCLARWTTRGVSRWVPASTLRHIGELRSGWTEATHYAGNCPVRIATAAEQAGTPRAVRGEVYQGRLIDASPAACAARNGGRGE